MRRSELLAGVGAKLGRRRLVWAGIRGDDVEALTDLPQLDAAFSIIGAYGRRSSIESLAYENLSGSRVDLETWDIDDHLETNEAVAFRRSLLRALARPSAVVPYRPSRFLSAVWFARRDRCLNLGLFGGHQAAFEHKPWVETSLASIGIPIIPWTYVADEDQLRTREFLDRGPLVLRRSRTSGGEGFVKVSDPAMLAELWPHAAEGFVSVAPYIDGALPLNVGATAWDDGVTVHHPSVQLIGIPACVTRPFGYCGNDFALAASLDPHILDQIERHTVTIGDWLRRFGYRGTFGVDYLVVDGKLLFTEVNPRFQGSTHASCRLSVEADESCLLLEHIGAVLGMPSPPQRSLRSLVAAAHPLAHIVVHWTGSTPRHLDPRSLVAPLVAKSTTLGVDVLTRLDLLTHPGAVVARITVRDVVTTSGFDLMPPYAHAVAAWAAGNMETNEIGLSPRA